MFLRSVRTPIAAARRFSAATAAAEAEKPSAIGAATKNDADAGGSAGRETLGKRLLKLVYPKRSAVIAIRKWKEEGRTVRKFELSHVVKELRKRRRYKHALEVSFFFFVDDEKLLTTYIYTYIHICIYCSF